MRHGSGIDKKEKIMKRLIIAIIVVLFTVTIGYGQSVERMDALDNEGSQFFRKENFYQAEQKWEQALKIAKSIGDKEKTVDILTSLGTACRRLGNNMNAIFHYEEALKICKEIGDKCYIGNIYLGLGDACLKLGDYGKSKSYLEDALEVYNKTGSKYESGAIFLLLGNIYFKLGNYAMAISYREDALKIHQELESNGTGLKGIEMIDNLSIGALYTYLGDYKKSIFYFDQAVEISEKLGSKKEGIELGLPWLGFYYFLAGDKNKAISFYNRGMKYCNKKEEKKEVGDFLLYCGTLYAYLGDYQTANSYFEQSLELYKKVKAPTENAKIHIADIWFKIGEFEKAEETYLSIGDPKRLGELNLVKGNFQKAIEIFEKLLNEYLESRDSESLFANYVLLGQAYQGLKHYDKAKEYYAKAIFMAEEQRESLTELEGGVSHSLGELTIKFFAGEKRNQAIEGIISVFMETDNPDDAFFYSENLKARVLSEAISKSHLTLDHSLSVSLAKEEDDYITKIRGLRKQIVALYLNKVMDIYYKKEAELKKEKVNQQKFINQLRKSYPEYVSIHYPQPIEYEKIKLNPNEVLVEFEVTDDATYVFILEDGKLKTRKVSISKKDIQGLVLKYRGFFEGITKTSQLLQYEPDVGKELYALLFGDLLNSVAKGTKLIIVPDEFLGILPFEALVMDLPAEEKIGEGEYGPFPLGVKYLGDKYLISYAQSATSLTLLRTIKKDRVKAEGMFVVADPIFSANDSRLRVVAKADISEENLNLMGAFADWKQMGVAGVIEKGENHEVSSEIDELFPRLEKTDELAQKMKLLFGSNVKILLGSDAMEDKVVMSSLPEYRYFTFATHGILDNTVPYIKEPALVLTQFVNPEGYDGFLTMTEVMGLKLEADVVALTACETGLGKNVSGEGVMGMGRAFQFAGSRNVLVSLWSVAETSATELTVAFFKNLKEGNEPKQSLRLARNEIRHKGYEHPFYWASFILFGE